MKARPSNLKRSLVIVSFLLGACADPAARSEGTSDPPSPIPSSESLSPPETASPSVMALPPSRQADRCVKDQLKWGAQWNAAMDFASASYAESGDMTEAETNDVREQVLEAADGLFVNAAAMEDVLEDEGPVRNGDQCLMSAATSLAQLSGLVHSEGPQWTRNTTKHVKRFFGAVLHFYPGTQAANEAQEGLDICHESGPTCYS